MDPVLRKVVDAIRAANPCRLVVLSPEEAKELMRQDKLRVWLDDVRPMPKEGFDVHVKTASEAINLIESGRVAFMSFDHDLGFDLKIMRCRDEPTGYDVAKAVERLAAEGKIEPFEWAVHSMNPTGAEKIVMALEQADKFWSAQRQNHESRTECVPTGQ